MRTRNLVAVAVAVTMLTLFAGCGEDEPEVTEAVDEPTTSASTEPEPSETAAEEPEETEEAPEAVTITIEGFEYTDPGTVAPGTEITVENLDDAAHTVTHEGGAFDLTIAPGETATFTAPDEPGEYPYICTFHAGMTGTLVVG